MLKQPFFNDEYAISLARPVIKWAGGKGQLLPKICNLLPNALSYGKINK